MSKLLEDEKVVKLVDREVGKAVKAERRRILEGLKALKVTPDDAADPVVKRITNKTIATANKVVREAA